MYILQIRKKFDGFNTSDDLGYEVTSIYFYFCRRYGKRIEVSDESERLMFKDTFGHELVAMMSEREYLQELYLQANFEEERKEFADILPKATAFSKSLSEYFFRVSTENPERKTPAALFAEFYEKQNGLPLTEEMLAYVEALFEKIGEEER